MKWYEKKLKEVDELVSWTCDICGKEMDGDFDCEGYEDHDYMDIEARFYTSWNGDGGEGVHYYLDVCPDCFLNKILPYLKSINANITRREYQF
jgi:hypothetical protein